MDRGVVIIIIIIIVVVVVIQELNYGAELAITLHPHSVFSALSGV